MCLALKATPNLNAKTARTCNSAKVCTQSSAASKTFREHQTSVPVTNKRTAQTANGTLLVSIKQCTNLPLSGSVQRTAVQAAKTKATNRHKLIAISKDILDR